MWGKALVSKGTSDPSEVKSRINELRSMFPRSPKNGRETTNVAESALGRKGEQFDQDLAAWLQSLLTLGGLLLADNRALFIQSYFRLLRGRLIK